ncbi:MAG: hypothetical protein ACRC3H_10365 [Lachnospiraceae bacterium]
MKRNYLAIAMGLIMGLSLMGGCSKSDEAVSTEDVYGEVVSVQDDSITIEIGTMQEMEQGGSMEEDSADSTGSVETPDSTDTTEESEAEVTTDKTEDTSTDSADDGQGTPPDGEGSDGQGTPPDGEGVGATTLDLTGEEQEITVTEDTVITSQSMGGGMQGGPGGDGEAPSGEAPSGEAPSAPSEDGETNDSSNTSEESTADESETATDETADSNEASEEAPATADNGDSQGTPPDDGAGDMGQTAEEITLADISTGDIVLVTFNDDGSAAEITVMSMGGGMQGGMQSGAPDSYDAVTEYTTDAEEDGYSYESTGTDENAIHVLNGAEVTLKNINVDRTSSDSEGGDNSSFYGIGAAVLTTDGTTYINNSNITTDASGGAGIFSYGEGVVYTADTTITTQQDTSGGIHVAGGGTLYAWDMEVETSGESAAAIRSDRGSGTMVVDGGTYTSNGVGSPAVYSTADITINNADMTATGSEAACIEGLNTIRLYDSYLTGNMSDDSQNDCTWNVILYQSMSGDSEEGNSTFEMYGGTLTAENGGMFYTTNTESTFVLSDVDITYAEDSEFFLKCTGNANQRGWGTTGANGADCHFTAINQTMTGDVIWDSISQLDMYMTEGSTLTGAFMNDETNAGDGGDGYSNLYIADGCTWTVTGDSTLSGLYCAGTITDDAGNTVTIEGTDGTVYVEGSSSYTITVDDYEETADLSAMSQTTQWEDYQVEKPSQLS